MNVSLSAPGPLDVASTLSRYRRWGEDPVNRLEDGRFRRALRVDGRWHGYDLSWTDDADRVQLTIAVPGTRSRRVVDAAVAEARHVLGLDLDVTAFYRAAAADPVVAVTGRSTTNDVPRPGSESTRMRPPWSFTML